MISRGDFPQQVQLGRRAVGWIAEDVLDWIRAKVDADLADSPTSTA
jgi:predicted DNA-binding transcriptional regulator AlpA